jgi:SAM-dependent methyltransferase
MPGLRERLARRIWTPPPPPRDPALVELDRLRDQWKQGPVRDERINEHLALVLEKSGVDGGRVLEIGGRAHPRGQVFDAERFDYLNLDLAETGPGVILGDITHCPEIEDASFDVVLSVDVFEHIDKPWLAGQEIGRILRPGGLVYTSTLFSWRYHPCPIDYWRYTPEALESLMVGTDTIDMGFDTTERRRDVRKKAAEDPMPYDALGGWRENVRVFHAGVKRG